MPGLTHNCPACDALAEEHRLRQHERARDAALATWARDYFYLCRDIGVQVFPPLAEIMAEEWRP